MSPFEIVWSTFEFHTTQINALEEEHLSNIASCIGLTNDAKQGSSLYLFLSIQNASISNMSL